MTDTLAIFGHEDKNNKSICVVEDFISTIKIARVNPSLCLWGSELSIQRLRRLAVFFDRLIIWLDKDKTAYSARCEIKARPYFSEITGIYTENDPKCYSTEAVKAWLMKN